MERAQACSLRGRGARGSSPLPRGAAAVARGGSGRPRDFRFTVFQPKRAFPKTLNRAVSACCWKFTGVPPPLKVKASRSIPESGGSSEGRGTRPRPGLGGWRRPGGGDSSNSTLGGERTESGPRFPRCLANLGVLPALAPGAPSPFSPSPDGAPPGAASAALGRGVPGGCAPRAAPRRSPPAVSVPALLAHPPLPMAAAVPAV